MLRVFLKSQRKSDPRAYCTRRFGPIMGLIRIETGASLYAVFEEIDKDPKDDIAAYVGLAEDIELGMYAKCGDVDLVYLVAVVRGKNRRRGVGRQRRGVGCRT